MKRDQDSFKVFGLHKGKYGAAVWDREDQVWEGKIGLDSGEVEFEIQVQTAGYMNMEFMGE